MNPPPSIILPSRRDALRWGAAGAVAAAGLGSVKSALGDCVLSPSETEGPYWVDEMLSRSDVRSDPSDGKSNRSPTWSALTCLVSWERRCRRAPRLLPPGWP